MKIERGCVICGSRFVTHTCYVENRGRKFCSRKCYYKHLKKFPPNKTHGMKKTRFYRIWERMRTRCYNVNCISYERYGGRGIVICEQWGRFEKFYNDMYKSYISARKEHGEHSISIDRIDNNGNYCKKNCRWATNKQQARNTSRNRFLTYNGETHTLMGWEELTGINRVTISSRIDRNGWSVKDALTKNVGEGQ